jgi:hypothetical protein
MSEKNVGRIRTRREKTGIGRKERQEGAGCATKRERERRSSVCRMDAGVSIFFASTSKIDSLLSYAACF